MSEATESLGDTIGNLADMMNDFEKNVRVDEEIPYPIEVASVKLPKENAGSLIPVGSWVSVRPAGQAKTYLGVFLGELLTTALSITAYHTVKKELSVLMKKNPAIFVPDLNRVVWGYESWWGRIKSPADLKQISDEDIQNVWYVKALKDLTAAAEPPVG